MITRKTTIVAVGRAGYTDAELGRLLDAPPAGDRPRLNLTARQVAILGTMSDPDAAEQIGTTAYAIRIERRARGIAPFRTGGVREGAGRPPKDGVKQDKRLGLTMTEPEMAEIVAAVPEGATLGRWVVEAALMRARGQGLDVVLAEALDRLHRCIVHDARDWSLTKRDALTYALVVGWSDVWADIAARHGWSEADIADLKRLHTAIDRCKALHRDDPADAPAAAEPDQPAIAST